MCIKIVTTQEEVEYDTQRPLEDQLEQSNKIVIDYHPEDTSIDKFMDEVERLCKTGVSCNLNIEVATNDSIGGARLKRKATKAELNLKLNDLIKLMATSQIHADNKLVEMLQVCLKR